MTELPSIRQFLVVRSLSLKKSTLNHTARSPAGPSSLNHYHTRILGLSAQRSRLGLPLQYDE